jgi:hypothetical protein
MSSESSPSVNAIPSIVIYDPSLGVPRYATGSALTNSTPQDVKIVDANGSQVTFVDLDIRNLTSTDVVTVTGGAGQTADVKVTLDSETVTVNAHAVTNAGTFAVQSTNDSLIGPGDPVIDSYTSDDITGAANTANQVLISSASNKQIWVYGIQFTLGTAAGTVSFQDEDDAAITSVMAMALNSGLGIPPSGNFAMPLWKLGTDKDLEVDTVTCSIAGSIQYAIVSV